MSPLRNSLIKASAGTGKTFALATRMIRLMLLGVEPNHIVALTFSRAAAGEIFNRVAGRLADAATSDTLAAAESRHLLLDLDPALADALRTRHGAAIPRPAFARLLRRLIATQHASLIGTIDSFMTRMVQAFPLELGLQGTLAIMDDYRVRREKNAAMSLLLNRAAPASETDPLSEAFRLATFGREGKSYSDKLAAFAETWHATLLDHPDPDQWGHPPRIWPGGPPFIPHDSPERLARRLADEIGPDWQTAGRETNWKEFCDFVRDFNTTFPPKASVQNVLKAYTPGATSIEISYNRKALCFTGAQARLILQTVETLYALALDARCQTTQGLHSLMAQFETLYAQNTRARGLLTFDDIPRLIACLNPAVRQNIEYRFDSRFSHWALDEFQDTSRAQWKAVSNLIDEAIQSQDGDRSVFIVGDMKQAIYGWRGGDVAIFEHEAASGHYALTDLDTTYRYCPQIADLVNRVFHGPAIETLLKPSAPDAGQKWARLWHPHTSLQPGGYASAEHVPPPDKDADETPIDPYLRAACRHLHALRPWQRGLTAAILVRTNEQGQRFADALRHDNIPAVWEGESAICDTPVVTALLHLLHAAEHPADTLAWQHVLASPLARVLLPDAPSLPPAHAAERLSRKLLDAVSRLGLPRALRACIDALPETSRDPFTRTRLDELVRAATQFTAAADAETTLTDFADFAASFITRDIADTSRVKILTVHRSKGLGFDLVILPVIETSGIDTSRPDSALFGPRHTWLLANPGKQVALADPVLAAAHREDLNSSVFEALCVHYVAMTRAKRALIMLLKPPAKTESDARYFSGHVAATLGTPLPWSSGSPESLTPPPPAPAPAAPPAPAIPLRPKRRTLRRVTPSAAVSCHGRAASALFSPRDGLAAQRGIRLHQALSRILWLDPAAPQPPGIPRSELDLTVPSPFRDALTRPAHATDLWRERAFELVIADEWISGTFDRVVFLEENGLRRAEILDFKSNRPHDGESPSAFASRMASAYSGQLASYRRALARLARLPESAIRCTLLLTSTRQTVNCQPGVTP